MSWTFNMQQDWIDVTSGRATIDPTWTSTDAAGHPHHYDHGYPTLRYVIDAQHFCDGTEGIYNHDPHWAVDEAHYECLQCDARIKPSRYPPYKTQSIPGLRSYSATGRLPNGYTVEFILNPDEFESVVGVDDPSPVMERLVADHPDRVMSMTSPGW